jgi:hypothetical protein
MKAAANQPNFVTSKRPAGAANITPSNPEGAKRNKPVYNLKGEIIRLGVAWPVTSLCLGLALWV